MIEGHLCAPTPVNEPARLAALRSYGILDTGFEGAFDDIAKIAAYVCRAPIAVVNFIDAERQWFKSEIGLGVRETPLTPSICAHAILQTELFVVPDTTLDDRFRFNPLVTGEPGLRFYAGAPLLTSDGLPIGTVCVLDHVARDIDDDQRSTLTSLARQVMAQLELRRTLARSEEDGRFRHRLMTTIGHDLKAPLRSALYSIARARRDAPAAIDERLIAAEHSLGMIDSEFNKLLTMAHGDDGASPEHTTFPVSDVVEGLVKMWQSAAERKKIALSYVPSRQWIQSHPVWLSTILGNLISNAIKYTREGRVLVGCRRAGDKLLIEVLDTGIGIEPSRAERIFDAFQQVDASSEGLGLGLWIVSRTAMMLDHPVRVRTVAGKGSRFSVAVPLAAKAPRDL
ncbi:MAG: GAF domain-containing sensor histidine kinase [Dokdonella sp.]